jgi:hypothetical protein
MQMLSTKKLGKIVLSRDFAAGVYLSEAQNPTHPLTHCIGVYCIQGRGEAQQFTILGRNTNMGVQYLLLAL